VYRAFGVWVYYRPLLLMPTPLVHLSYTSLVDMQASFADMQEPVFTDMVSSLMIERAFCVWRLSCPHLPMHTALCVCVQYRALSPTYRPVLPTRLFVF